jgi:TM2 domain-containing membrane protein YozV
MIATCPYCRSPFDPADTDDPPVTCSGCSTAHHASCLADNGGCTVFGCSQAPIEEPRISVTSTELTSPFVTPPPPPRTPVPPPPRTPVPPPPRRPDAPPQVFLHPATTAPTMAPAPSFSFDGYASVPPLVDPNSRYVVRKNRVAFVVLAIFFGSLGVHNFYAGYIKKAVIQCCLTVFTFFIASPFVWIWAVVEACRVDRDDDGVLFN